MPVFGVLFLGWEVFPVVYLFWCENIVVGVFNVARMAVCVPKVPVAQFAKLFLIPFFCVHYGIFTSVHGIFVISLFGDGPAAQPISGRFEPLFRDHLIWAVLALFVSHALSFWINYIGKKEYRRTTLQRLMGQPYARVVVLHITIILSGFLVVGLGLPSATLVILIALKIVVDLKAHGREHRKLEATPSETGAGT